jgi:transcriptional regulator
MYKLPSFQEQDPNKVIAFIKENSFAVISSNGDQYPVATQIPLAIEEVAGIILLKGHLMKNTDHHKAFLKNSKVLVLFTGPHCYISAGWYSDVQSASTWNYMTVHAKGTISFTDDEGTYKAIEAVTNQYEGIDSPASFQHIPPGYIDKLINAIVGFTIEVESIDNVFKLSQNKTLAEQETIIEKLLIQDDFNAKAIAGEMQKRGG